MDRINWHVGQLLRQPDDARFQLTEQFRLAACAFWKENHDIGGGQCLVYLAQDFSVRKAPLSDDRNNAHHSAGKPGSPTPAQEILR